MQEPIPIPPFLVDLAAGSLSRHGREIRLRRKTFSLLRYLLVHRDRLLTKEELLDQVWADAHVGDAVLKVTISQIRKIFRECPALAIETSHGRGYCVRLDESPGRAGAGSADGAAHRALTGRDAELAALEESWAAVPGGERRLVLISGEAGIGKSALVETFLERIARGSAASRRPAVARCSCLPVTGAGEPLRPVFAAVAALARTQPDPAASELLARFAPHLCDEAEPPLPQPQHGETVVLDSLATVVEGLASVRPVVVVLEDLHWADPQTVALLASLFERDGDARLLVLATWRPGDLGVAIATALRDVAIAHPARVRTMRLDALTSADVARLVGRDLGDAPPELARFLAERSGGNPLFVDRLLLHLKSCGALLRREHRWVFDEAVVARSGIPGDLAHFLATQLDLLDPESRRVLEAACVAGTTFTAQDVAAVTGSTVERVEAVCDTLAGRHQLLEMCGVRSRADAVVGTEYQFRHPLLQNVAYGRLAEPKRRDLHLRLARQLERSYGELAVLNAHELKGHFERGGDADRALHWLRVAAHVAVQRGMHDDARRYLGEVSHAIESDDDGRGRLDAATELARLLVIYSGPNAETSAAVERALELHGNPPAAPEENADEQPTFLLLAMHVVQGELRRAHDVAERLVAASAGDVAPEVRLAMGLALYGRQRPADAMAELAAAIADERAVHGLTVDHTMMAHAVLALCLQQAGRFAEACGHYDVALSRARASEAPVNRTIGLGFLTELHLVRGDVVWAAHLARETERISERHDLRSFVGQARFTIALAEFERTAGVDALARMEESLAGCRATAHGLGVPYLEALFAQAALRAGRIDVARRFADGALAEAQRSGETRAEAEIRRLRAKVLARSEAETAAVTEELEAAVAVAGGTGSHLFALRAALDLAAVRSGDARYAACLRTAADAAAAAAADVPELRAARDLVATIA